MANETTLTTLTELVHSEWINPFILSYAANYKNPSQFLLRMDPLNGSTTVSAPRWVSDEGDVNDEGVGEVCVRARSVMRGYLDAPELTEEAIVDGFLRTGDLGVIDASGHLKLVGRENNPADPNFGKVVAGYLIKNAVA